MIGSHPQTFGHLASMADGRGLFEHADGTQRRLEHGYCTDDNARLLVVASREPDQGLPSVLSRLALGFSLAAQAPDGRVRNRMSSAGRWTDSFNTEDSWGRSLWGFGVAATHHDDPDVRATALAAFDKGVRQRSRYPHAMAFAALGAAEVVSAGLGQRGAVGILRDAVDAIGAPGPGSWAWPQPRLTYANAALAEALIATGAALADDAVVERGLTMLDWLLDRETSRGHLSVTGVGGADCTIVGPQFDQQPIEVAAMADACWRASTLTGDSRWTVGLEVADSWFDGSNDVEAVMWDAATGGGFDGLRPDGVNLNQGAESTLALVSTRQRARSREAVS